MVLHVESDASCILFTDTKICTQGQFSLGNWPPPKIAKQNLKQNGPILIEFRSINNVVSYAAEYETVGVLNNINV